jgi:hypothetical protein
LEKNRRVDNMDLKKLLFGYSPHIGVVEAYGQMERAR